MADHDTYELAPEPAQVTAPAPTTSPGPPALAYQTVLDRDRDDYDVTEGDRFKNLFLPVVLVLIGCAAVFGRLTYFEVFAKRTAAADAWWWTGFMLVWNVAVMLLGAFAIARFTGITFGPLSTATIKLAAIAVAPHAVIFLFELIFVREFHGSLLGWLASGAFAWWLFVYLFDLDFQEALICAGVTTAMRWFSYLIYWLS